MIVTQSEKAVRFQVLHRKAGAFLIPNPWDPGSARVLAGLGFQAFATSSGASAAALGRRDGNLTRGEALASARAIADATEVPVSADLENGFGDTPEAVAETVRLAAEAGLVGCSIEDSTGNKDKPLYDIPFAVERMKAARAAIDKAAPDVMLTGRAEGFISGVPDLEQMIARLKAYSAAGADGLKMFPAEQLAPAVLKAWRAVLPKGTLVFPVGGIRPDNMAPYWAVGADGFGTGSNLYKPGAAPQEVAAIAAQFATACAALKQS